MLTVYGIDSWGQDVVRGYGSVHFPTTLEGERFRMVPRDVVVLIQIGP